jgi:hypothetical protein
MLSYASLAVSEGVPWNRDALVPLLSGVAFVWLREDLSVDRVGIATPMEIAVEATCHEILRGVVAWVPVQVISHQIVRQGIWADS